MILFLARWSAHLITLTHTTTRQDIRSTSNHRIRKTHSYLIVQGCCPQCRRPSHFAPWHASTEGIPKKMRPRRMSLPAHYVSYPSLYVYRTLTVSTDTPRMSQQNKYPQAYIVRTPGSEARGGRHCKDTKLASMPQNVILYAPSGSGCFKTNTFAPP